jgi:hypothetical protein
MGGEAIPIPTPTPTPRRTGDRVRVPPFGLSTSTSTKGAERVLTSAATEESDPRPDVRGYGARDDEILAREAESGRGALSPAGR